MPISCEKIAEETDMARANIIDTFFIIKQILANNHLKRWRYFGLNKGKS
jgi:hypothetical protein